MEQRHLPAEHKHADGYAPASFASVASYAVEEKIEAEEIAEESANARVQAHAAESAATLGAALSREARLHQQKSRRGIWGMAGVVALLTFVSILARNVLGPERMSDIVLAPGFQLFFGLLWLSVVGFLLDSTFRPRRRRRKNARALAEREDVRSVGALIDCQKLDDPKVHQIVFDALIPLLPRLQASDADLLNAEQRARLNRILSLPIENVLFKDMQSLLGPSGGRRVEIRVAILKAFSQVGDDTSLPIVRRLADQEAKTAAQQRIRAAAQDCLPALEQRVTTVRSSQTLLRPSSLSESAPDTLLRAASETSLEPPDQLLRAGSLEA